MKNANETIGTFLDDLSIFPCKTIIQPNKSGCFIFQFKTKCMVVNYFKYRPTMKLCFVFVCIVACIDFSTCLFEDQIGKFDWLVCLVSPWYLFMNEKCVYIEFVPICQSHVVELWDSVLSVRLSVCRHFVVDTIQGALLARSGPNLVGRYQVDWGLTRTPIVFCRTRAQKASQNRMSHLTVT